MIGRDQEKKLEAGEHIDPICGMRVREDAAAATSNLGGEVYYFCSFQCKTQFDSNPERFSKAMSEKGIG